MNEPDTSVAHELQRIATALEQIVGLLAGDSDDDGKTPGGRERWTRQRLTPEMMSAIADVYRSADERGLPPVKAVAEVWGKSIRTASRWVAVAREGGYLTQSNQ